LTPATTNFPLPTTLNHAQRTYHVPAPSAVVRGTSSDQLRCPPARAFFVVPLCIVWSAYVTTGVQAEPDFVFTLITRACPRVTVGAPAAGAADAVAAQSASPAIVSVARRRCGTDSPKQSVSVRPRSVYVLILPRAAPGRLPLFRD